MHVCFVMQIIVMTIYLDLDSEIQSIDDGQLQDVVVTKTMLEIADDKSHSSLMNLQGIYTYIITFIVQHFSYDMPVVD